MSSMAVIERPRNTKMASDIFQVILIVNAFHQICMCLGSVDMQGQAFIQTDNELRYMMDTGSLHHTPEPEVSVVRFDPPVLDFNEQPVGMPFLEQVIVQNLDSRASLHLLSISGSTLHFHCSFFQDKMVPPLGNTTFEVVFLARQVGNVENTLYIHSSKGSFKYQVFGVGIQNPYRVRPFLGARVPVNSSFSPLIRLYNPYGSTLQVEEIYTSGGDLHLELPTGEREASKDLWEIPPFETKSIMKANFLGRIENNHTAFIRIKTNKDNKQEMLILPVEVEVTSAPGIYSLLELLDFGILRTLDEPSTLRLNLINSGSKPIQIANITVEPANSAVHIDFRPIQVKSDVLHPTFVALISFTASQTILSNQWNGKIIIRSKNAQYNLTIPYQAHVLHGSLVYDRNKTMFYTGASRNTNLTHDFSITNTFNFTVVVYNISLHPSIQRSFTISNFSYPFLIGQQQTLTVFNLTFHPNSSMLHFTSEIYLHTNMSVFKIPLHVYNGRLKVVHHRPEIFKGQLDFGTMAVMEKRTMNFTLRNDNPVNIIISKFFSNMERTVVSLLGVEKGNGTTLSYNNTSKTDTDPLILKSYHMAVFSVELIAPDYEGTFSAEVIIDTQFEHLYLPMTLLTAVGSLHIIPDKLVLNKCFPGKISQIDLRVRSTFHHQLSARDVTFTPNDLRFYYVPAKDRHVMLLPDQENLIGQIYFDPRRECRDDCYVTLSTHIPAGQTWLLGSSLDKDVTDTDQYLFTRFRQKWQHLGTSQTSTVNVTVQLDTNQVRGFLFPAQAHLHWPTLVKHSKIKFPLTQIGNTSILEFTLENPSDIPVVVHIVPAALYPNAQFLLDMIVPYLPPEFTNNYLESEDIDIFTLQNISDNSPSSLDNRSVPLSPSTTRKSIENTLGIRPSRNTFAFIVQSRSKVPIRVAFQPKDHLARSSLFFIRNNLTIIETVVVEGQGGLAELRFNTKKPGSQKPLMFEVTDKHLKNCDKKMHSKNIQPNFTVKRTFTMRNSGQLPVYLHGFSVGNSPCEGYGFKVLDCSEMELQPNETHKVDIVFTPDFTMSRIRQILTLHTSLGTPVNYSLQATIPSHMLTQCASALPRPAWEPLLYYTIVLTMAFLLFCIIVAACFESDRLFTADVIRRRSELNHYDKNMVFDLKAIAAGLKRSSDGSSKISSSSFSNSYVSRSRISAQINNGYVETGKSSIGTGGASSSHPTHQKESFLSKVLRKLSFWKSFSSSAAATATATHSPPITKQMMASTDVGIKDAVTAESVKIVASQSSGSNVAPVERNSHGVGRLKRCCKYLAESYVVRGVFRQIWKIFSTKRSKTTKPTKCTNDKAKDLTTTTTTTTFSDGNVEPVQPPVTSVQKKNTEQEHSKQHLLAVKSSSVLNNKDKNHLVSPTSNSLSVAHGPDEQMNAKKDATKTVKAIKAKASSARLRSLRKKFQENEKVIDKDDSSSTTTETSSIEADEKNTSNRTQEIAVPPRAKKPRSKVKTTTKNVLSLEDVVSSAPPKMAAPTSTSDEFLSTSKPTKNNQKAKADVNRSYSPNILKPSSLELPYTMKREESSSKDCKPKQVCLPLTSHSPPPPPPPSTTTITAKKNSNRKKNSDFRRDNYYERHGSPPSPSLSLWDMPEKDCDHDGLSELAAQTDIFAKTRVGELSSLAATSKSSIGFISPTPPHPPNRTSSYSSIVSNINDNQAPIISKIQKPNPPDNILVGLSTAPDNMIMSGHSCSPGIAMSGTMATRQAAPSRPVAAVGATVRRSWTEDLNMGLCQAGGLRESDLQFNSSSSGGGMSYVDPAIMDPAIVGGYSAISPGYLRHEGGYIPSSGPMISNHPMEKQTLMQRLQAERRKRVFEYEMKKRTGGEWPGFDIPLVTSSMTSEPVWDPNIAFTQPWSSMSSGPLGGGAKASNATPIWNMGPSSHDPIRGWIGNNIWSSPELPAVDVKDAGGDEMQPDNGSSTGTSAPPPPPPLPIFDPFNSLEIGTGSIWNPNTGSGGMTGWGFRNTKPSGDNNIN